MILSEKSATFRGHALDFAFGRLALARLALGEAARFLAGAPDLPPDPLLKTLLVPRSTVNLSPTPVLPDFGSTVTNTPTTDVGEMVNRKNPKVLSLYTSSLRGFPLASVPDCGVFGVGGRRFGGFKRRL
jgi:hypothetical protein